MKKVLIINLLFFSSFFSLGQSQNQLNTFLLESILDYNHDYNQFLNKTQRKDTIEYLCVDCIDGLPYDFPYDSLYLKTLSISSIENNPKTTKKALKRFVETMRVSYSLENNVIDIVISKCRIKRMRKGRMQMEVDGESASHYYYEYNCETSNWERVIKCVYSDIITQSFVCLQSDSISVYYKSPNLETSSLFYGTYRYSNDTLRLSDNLLNDGMKPDDYQFVLDSTRRTLSIMPSLSTIKDTTSNGPLDPKAMLLGRQFKNTSCFEELKKVL